MSAGSAKEKTKGTIASKGGDRKHWAAEPIEALILEFQKAAAGFDRLGHVVVWLEDPRLDIQSTPRLDAGEPTFRGVAYSEWPSILGQDATGGDRRPFKLTHYDDTDSVQIKPDSAIRPVEVSGKRVVGYFFDREGFGNEDCYLDWCNSRHLSRHRGGEPRDDVSNSFRGLVAFGELAPRAARACDVCVAPNGRHAVDLWLAHLYSTIQPETRKARVFGLTLCFQILDSVFKYSASTLTKKVSSTVRQAKKKGGAPTRYDAAEDTDLLKDWGRQGRMANHWSDFAATVGLEKRKSPRLKPEPESENGDKK